MSRKKKKKLVGAFFPVLCADRTLIITRKKSRRCSLARVVQLSISYTGGGVPLNGYRRVFGYKLGASTGPAERRHAGSRVISSFLSPRAAG